MKNKMTMITLVILLIPAFSLQAGIRIGAKAGVNLAKAALNTDALKTDNFTGFQVGPVIEISGLSGLGVDAAILYSRQGLKIKEGIFTYKEKVSTLDVPVNLKLKFSLTDIVGCYLSAGPYVSFKLDDQDNFSEIQNSFKEQWTNKEFGVGLNFGVGVELVKHLQVGVNYQFALNDDYKNCISSYWENTLFHGLDAKTRIWSITATFFF